MTARLNAALFVAALMRLAQAAGGFAAVLHKGDATSGSMLVILTERGGNPRVLERLLQSGGDYIWTNITSQVSDLEEKTANLVEKRRRFDPDLWVIELDVPSPERFAAEMNRLG